MNTKFLVWTSLLIALLLHLAFFSLTTFVFPIDPAALKPKFFFLGPILSKSDVKQVLPSNDYPAPNSMKGTHSREDYLKSVGSKIVDRTENPFAISAIKKPLMPQTDASERKIVIKSTFEASLEKEPVEEAEVEQPIRSELKIRPYKPLQFRPSKDD